MPGCPPSKTWTTGPSGQSISVNSEQPDTQLPVRYWVLVSIAPSSLAVKSGTATTEIWIGTLASQMLVHLTLAGNCVVTEERLLRHQLGRIRDVRLDANGVPYLLTDGGEGALYRVELAHREARAGGKSRM